MKTKLFLLTFIFCTKIVAQIPTTNLDSEYKFTSGSLNDTYGTAENLTQTGSAATFTTDRYTNASNAINLGGDYLKRVPLQNSTSLSVSFWIKTSTNDNLGRIIMEQSERNSNANTTSLRGWYVYLRSGIVRMSVNYKYNYQATGQNTVSGNTGWFDCAATSNIADNNWHHISITIAGRVYFWQSSYWMYENVYKIYVDNVLQNTITKSYPTYISSGWCSPIDFLPNNNVVIGNNSSENLISDNRFSEGIDDIRMYKTTLSQANVTSLFNEANALKVDDFNSFSDFSIYPNPANDLISIKSEETIESLEVLSLEGRKIKSTNASTIDVSNLTNGMYLLQVKTEDGKIGSKKIIKN